MHIKMFTNCVKDVSFGICGVFRMIETCSASPSVEQKLAKHCRTIWEMKFPTLPPLCFQTHTIAQQKKEQRSFFCRFYIQYKDVKL